MSDTTIDPAKQEKLKAIIGRLHDGAPVKDVKRDFARLIDGVSAAEVATMEQALIDAGMPVEEVQRLCEVHVQVFQGELSKGERQERMPGHPIHTMNAENREAKARISRVLSLSLAWRLGADKARDTAAAFEDLSRITVHYTRKENQLFPYLERQGFTGPSRVMWGKHDEIRAMIGQARSALQEGPAAFRRVMRPLAGKMKRMMFMEERILMPESVRRLSDRDWAEIRKGEDAIGFAWVQPSSVYDAGLVLSGAVGAGGAAGTGGTGTAARVPTLSELIANAKPIADPAGEVASAAGAAGTAAADSGDTVVKGLLQMAEGKIDLGLLNIALNRMPADISVVDENDRVLYYSDNPHRIFPRSPAAIGRTVQNCHPQKSVDTVNRILDAFRKKERDRARFWIQMGGRFILIEYYALYDSTGAYRGTLEVSQDATEIRALEGQRRLLDWE